jgi:hypothetical protein
MGSNVGMRTLGVIAVMALGLTGCANAEVPQAGSTAPTTPPVSTSTGPTSTTTAVTTEPITGPVTPSTQGTTTSRPLVPSSITPVPPTNANEVTIEGVVQAGVEAGCKLLVSQGAQYLLLGGDPAVLREGQRVIVRGKVEAGVATTCQQGVPFIVAEVRPT